MINLLNPQEMKQLRAARVNVRLRRYVVATIASIAVVTGVYFVGYKMADDGYAMAQQEHAAAQKNLESYADVKKKAETYQANLTIAKKILSNEIVFSKFMTDVAAILPPNTMLNGLTLTTKPVANPQKKPGSTQLKARTKSYADVLILKTKLEESDIFSNVRIASTNTPNSTTGKTGIELLYPFEVTYDVVIDKLGGSTK